MVLGQCESGVREGSGLGTMYESGVREVEWSRDNVRVG